MKTDLPAYQFSPLGNAALLIDFGNIMDEEVNLLVLQLFYRLKQRHPKGIVDLVPAYSSLAVFYDVALLSSTTDTHHTVFDTVVSLVKKELDALPALPSFPKRSLRIPVCYAHDFSLDLPEIAAQAGMSANEVIRLHTARTYRVYMIGFLPGFAYMGEVDHAIAVPRKKEPRTKVAAGSVGIAGKQTGIYPIDSPGGWQIIGRTPLSLFDKNASSPALLQPGDEITFYPITKDEFENYPGRHF